MLSREAIVNEMKRLGYKVFETGDYNLNIVGLRKQPGTPNAFDDLLVVFYKVGGQWVMECFPCTTDPGTYYLRAPMNVAGTAIIVPGQYIGSHQIGLHGGKYPALVQRGSMKVWRDADKDDVLDYDGPIVTATGAGLNIHHAGTASTQVDRWSAGCQVIASLSNWNRFWSLIEQSAAKYGTTFSYTLLDWPHGF